MKIKQYLGKWFLFLIGWELRINVERIPKKCVVIGAPHSTWLDVVIGIAGAAQLNLKLHYLAKKELFRFPWRFLFVGSGAIPVDRFSVGAADDRKRIVQELVQDFATRQSMILVISPEGTRKKVKRWKTGFYRIAQQADVPILLCYVDHVNKIACVDKIFRPAKDQNGDLRLIMNYFSSVPIKHPDRFSLDTRYI